MDDWLVEMQERCKFNAANTPGELANAGLQTVLDYGDPIDRDCRVTKKAKGKRRKPIK